MSEAATRSTMDELRLALAQGVSIEGFHRETSRVGHIIWFIRATVTATKNDGTPKTVQFSTHELYLPLGQDQLFYPESVKNVLDLIRRTATAIQ